MKKRIVPTLAALLCLTAVSAQKLAVKSNLLYDITTTLNLGVEVALAPKWTLDLSANYNPWTFSANRKFKHYLVQPELRYWTRQRFGGHFLGVHAGWGEYNVGGLSIPTVTQAKSHRYEGWATMAGLSYGYALPLGQYWSMEFGLGLGWIHTRYDQFKCPRCGERIASGITANRFAPTKVAISLVYTIGGRPTRQPLPVAEHPLPTTIAPPPPQAELPPPVEEIVQAEATHTPEVVAQPRPKEYVLRFATGRTRIDPTLPHNREVLAAVIAAATPVPALTPGAPPKYRRVTITGYASPEGALLVNNRLAQARAESFRAYLKQQLPSLPDSTIVLRNGGEDWQGLRRMVAADSTMQYRAEVLAIIDRVPIAQGREKQLMDLKWGRPYGYMEKKFFPALRSVCYIFIDNKE